jgi:large subunit ribosomal protein L17
MRHQRAGKKLGRTVSHRDAMFRNMVTSLFAYGKIRTTDAKAKELRRWADHMITLAKRGDLHARRQALAVVRSKAVVHKLFEEVAQKFGMRAGGYTRIVKIGTRPGDAAPVSLVELVVPEEDAAAKKKKPAKAAKKAAKPKKESKKKAQAKETPGEAVAAAAGSEVEDTAKSPEPATQEAADKKEDEEKA